jgi:hypothetical protein
MNSIAPVLRRKSSSRFAGDWLHPSDSAIAAVRSRLPPAIPKETLDAGPYLLKESTESIPSLLQQADEDRPAIGDEVGGFRPSSLQTSPRVVLKRFR